MYLPRNDLLPHFSLCRPRNKNFGIPKSPAAATTTTWHTHGEPLQFRFFFPPSHTSTNFILQRKHNQKSSKTSLVSYSLVLFYSQLIACLFLVSSSDYFRPVSIERVFADLFQQLLSLTLASPPRTFSPRTTPLVVSSSKSRPPLPTVW